MKLSIVITAFKEPKTIGKAIEAFLKQHIKVDYEIIAAAPDQETSEVIKKYSKKFKEVKYFKDPGQGKMLALNMLFKKVKGEIIVFTDGDVHVSNNSINEILKAFEDERVGCICGRVVSTDSRDNMLGYWSHLLTDAGAHEERWKRSNRGKYFTVSGYLFAIRNGIVKEFDRNIPEDAIIPFMAMKKGYKLVYLPKAEVYVKYPDNMKEWISQKKRIAKAYENMKDVKVDGEPIPKMKSFMKEALIGVTRIFSYPRSLKELFWTLWLIPTRLYVWMMSYYETYITKKKHTDAWKRVESTK